jgi:lysophospholipase L1-like esterase
MMKRWYVLTLVALLTALTACTSSAPTRVFTTISPTHARGASLRRDVATSLRILTLGDSRSVCLDLTQPCSAGPWQDELARELGAVGVTVTVFNPSVGGTDCHYWTDKISGLLTQFKPDVVILACGTNDTPAALCYGESCTGWSERVVAEATHAFGAKFMPTLPQYSDPILAPGWLLLNEPQNADNLYRQFHYYQSPNATPSWFTVVPDFEVIPATASYLKADPYPLDAVGWIGIHPNDRGHRYMGRLVLDAGALNGWWPPSSAQPLCDLYGHRNGYPRPAYTPC